mgnify:FL=1
MNNFFDTDYLIIVVGIILLITIEDLNPYVIFFGSIVIIIAGIYKIILIHYNIRKTKEELKKLK